MAIQLHPSMAVHPGPWLKRNVIDRHGMTVIDAAARLHLTRQAMSNLLNGNSGLSADMAIRFEKAFGLKAEVLMRMQAGHELAEARKHKAEIEVKRVVA
jgi:addiction module HigA family antidote